VLRFGVPGPTFHDAMGIGSVKHAPPLAALLHSRRGQAVSPSHHLPPANWHVATSIQNAGQTTVAFCVTCIMLHSACVMLHSVCVIYMMLHSVR